jgi:ATP/ADP translocase
MQKDQGLSVRCPIVEIPYGITINIGELLWRRLLAQSVPYMKTNVIYLCSYQVVFYTISILVNTCYIDD